MLRIALIPVLMRIISKIDLLPIINKIKEVDIFKNVNSKEEALNELDKEKIGILGMETLSEIIPQLGRISDDIPELVAEYKGISIAEAKNLDDLEVFSELLGDKGVIGFFKTALRKKVEQKH